MEGASGLGGRRRYRAASWRATRLVAVLCVAVGAIALQRFVDYEAIVAAHEANRYESSFAHQLSNVETLVFSLAPLLGGVLIDLYGTRKVVAATVVGWCAVVSAGAALASPASFALGAPMAVFLLPGFILVGVLVAIAHALAPKRRGMAVAIVLLAYTYARLPRTMHELLVQGGYGWPEALYASVTCGIAILVIWLAFYRDARFASVPRLSAERTVVPRLGRIPWIIVWLELWIAIILGVVWRGSVSLQDLTRAMLPPTVILQTTVMPLAFLLAVYGSDRLSRRLGSRLASRRLVITMAFAAFAIVVVAIAQGRPAPALPILVGALVGVLRLTDLLVVDYAPPRATGTFIGIVLSGELLSVWYVRPLVLSASASLGLDTNGLLAIACIVGALSAALLLRRSICGEIVSSGRGANGRRFAGRP